MNSTYRDNTIMDKEEFERFLDKMCESPNRAIQGMFSKVRDDEQKTMALFDRIISDPEISKSGNLDMLRLCYYGGTERSYMDDSTLAVTYRLSACTMWLWLNGKVDGHFVFRIRQLAIEDFNKSTVERILTTCANTYCYTPSEQECDFLLASVERHERIC